VFGRIIQIADSSSILLATYLMLVRAEVRRTQEIRRTKKKAKKGEGVEKIQVENQ
jgi:hypothetical protein